MHSVAFWHLYLPGIIILHQDVRYTPHRSLDSVLMPNAPHKIGSYNLLSQFEDKQCIDHQKKQV